jgi:hypothetical protein
MGLIADMAHKDMDMEDMDTEVMVLMERSI